MSESRKPYSYHVFLFPFSWDYTHPQGNASFEEKTELSKFLTFLDETQKWERLTFEPDTILKYNEFNYFYDFARDILYDRGKDDTIISHLQHKDFLNEGKEFRFEVHNHNGDNYLYSLKIDSILLHLYNTGVGVLSFHLINRDEKQKSEADILRINQFGRRLFPPFYALDEGIIGSKEQFENKDFEAALERTKTIEMPCWIDLGNDSFRESFTYLNGASPQPFQGFWLPKFFEELFPLDLLTLDKNDTDKNVCISPVLDDRMFVVCWHGNDKLVKNIKPMKLKTKTIYPHLSDEFLYKYIFVDAGLKTCQNDSMTIEAIETSANARWVKFGTLYGASRYSFVCLTNEIDVLKQEKSAFLLTHVQTIYYKIVELVLVQRACLLRFADEVTELSNLANTDELTNRVGNLYKQYIRFVNKIYFREVTAQEQGIEIYDLLQRKMRIERDVKELNSEIQELHQYAILMEEKRRREIEEENQRLEAIKTEKRDRLTLLATTIAFPALIASIFGISTYSPNLTFTGSLRNLDWHLIIPLALIFISGLIAFCYWKKLLKK